MLGNTLLVLSDRGGGGKILEVNTEKKELWKIEGLQLPTDAVMVGRDRVLIAEQNADSYQRARLDGERDLDAPS